MKVMILSLCFAVIVVSVCAMPILAEVRWVSGSNSGNDLEMANDCRDDKIPCRTLTHAIRIAKPGDTIQASGTFDAASEIAAKRATESGDLSLILVTKPLAIEGQSATIDAKGWPVTVDNAADLPVAIIKLTADGSTLAGFKIQGSIVVKMKSQTTGTKEVNVIGILVDRAQVTVHKNELTSISATAENAQIKLTITAIFLHQTQGSIVGGIPCDPKTTPNDCNQIKKSSASIATEAIKILGGEGNTIAYNIITGSGVIVEGSEGNEIQENILDVTGGDGIFVSDSNSNKISNNVVCFEKDSQDPRQCSKKEDGLRSGNGIHVRTSSMSVGNQLVHNTVNRYATGILLEGAFAGVTVERNITTMNKTGISLIGKAFNGISVSDATISENIANDNTEHGISLALEGEGSGITLLSNEVQNNGYGISYVQTQSVVVGMQPTFRSHGLGSTSRPLWVIANKAIGNMQWGIRLKNILQSLVEGNLTTGKPAAGTPPAVISEVGILVEDASEIRLISNEARLNSAGIAARGGGQNELRENLTAENTIGISLQDTSSNVLTGNEVSNNQCHGIELRSGQSNQVSFNTIINNAQKCATSTSDPKQLLGGGLVLIVQSGSRVHNNTIEGNYNGISVRDNSPSNTFFCNSIVGNTKNGIQVISKDDQAIGNRLFRNNIADNNKAANKQYGLRNFMNTAVVDAEYNWWGHQDGPTHPDNPPRPDNADKKNGDAILGPVDFRPWLESPIDPQTCS